MVLTTIGLLGFLYRPFGSTPRASRKLASKQMASVLPVGGEFEAGQGADGLPPDRGAGPLGESPPHSPQAHFGKGTKITDHAEGVDNVLGGLSMLELPGRTGWLAIGENDSLATCSLLF